MHSDELLFTVEETIATPVSRVDLAALGFTERGHLQEWVVAHPELLGPDVLIITFEFDQWSITSGAAPRDRLDVLGLGGDGRLVVAELKRGRAPDTVDLQAIKYAAMASRFDLDMLAQLHATFMEKSQKQTISAADALEKLQAHTATGVTEDALLHPRIVLLAEDFSATVTSSVVWLNEQGVEIALRRYLAYRTAAGATVITVSSIYPVPDVEDFEVKPRLRSTTTVPDILPVVPWSSEDLSLLRSLPFEMPHAILDLCSTEPGTWIGSKDAYELAGVSQKSGMGKLAGFGVSVRTRFKRSNAPWLTEWNVLGGDQQYYRIDPETAALWLGVQAGQEGVESTESSNQEALDT